MKKKSIGKRHTPCYTKYVTTPSGRVKKIRKPVQFSSHTAAECSHGAGIHSTDAQGPEPGASTSPHLGEADAVTCEIEGYYARKVTEVANWTAARDQLLQLSILKGLRGL